MQLVDKQYIVFKYQCFIVGAKVLFFHEIYNELIWGTISKVLKDEEFKAGAIVEFTHNNREQNYEIKFSREDYVLEQLFNYKKDPKIYKTHLQTYLNNISINTPVSMVSISLGLFARRKDIQEVNDVLNFMIDEAYTVMRISRKNIKIEKNNTVYMSYHTVTTTRGIVLNHNGTKFVNISGKHIHDDSWFAEQLFNLYQEYDDDARRRDHNDKNLYDKINKIVDKFNERCFEEAERYYNKLIGHNND